jgi:hypothetical protein
MEEQRTDVLVTRPPDEWARPLAAGLRHPARLTVMRTGADRPPGADLATSSTFPPPLRGAGTAGGMVPSDDDLLERTLAFSGSYVSDDGQVTIRRSSGGSFEYSGARFVGHCHVCSRAGLTSSGGDPLPDVRAAVRFVATHDHGEGD